LTSHLNEDRLIQFYLEMIVDDFDRAELASHLETCDECRAALQRLTANLDSVARFSLPPLHEHYQMPRKTASHKRYWLKVAAMLAVTTFGSVYFALQWHSGVLVEPMKMEITPPPDSMYVRLAFAADELRVRPHTSLIPRN